VAKFGKRAKLEDVVHRYDDVVMDTRGGFDELSLELAKSADVIFLPASFSMDDISPTLNVIAELRSEAIASSRVAVVFCRTGGSQRQAEHARSILRMNDIIALDAVLPQRDGFASLAGTGRTGREAPGALQGIAMAMDQALLRFVDVATGVPGAAPAAVSAA
jgi:cellulose biosynthesis protein BcsQ